MSSRSGLFGEHVFKVRDIKKSCLQCQACVVIMSSWSGLCRGSVFKVSSVNSSVNRSCLQGQCCLEVMSSRSGLFRCSVFKVRIV